MIVMQKVSCLSIISLSALYSADSQLIMSMH